MNEKNSSGSPATNLKPSDEARKMKRDQSKVHEENVIALFNKRSDAENVIKQVNADLDHIGYNWPMSAPEPKRLTEYEWDSLLDINGKMVVNKGHIHNMEQEIIMLQHEKSAEVARANRYRSKIEKLNSAKKTAKKK